MKTIFLLVILVTLGFSVCNAQIEVAHVSSKDFKATGFGAFLNYSLPVSDANYMTIEGGFQLFKNNENSVLLIPCLVGYRYTLDQSGTGFYIEPNAGYTFGGTDIGKYANNSPVYNENGEQAYEKVAGPAAGVGVGYLFEPGMLQLNLGIRYEHTFGGMNTNLYTFRISHAFSFGRRNSY